MGRAAAGAAKKVPAAEADLILILLYHALKRMRKSSIPAKLHDLSG